MQKKVFSTILILCVLLCTMALTLSVGAATSVASEGTDTIGGHDWTYDTIDGVRTYIVDGDDDLAELAGAASSTDAAVLALLDANFIIPNTTGSTTVEAKKLTLYAPIGSSSHPFTGTFIGELNNSTRRAVYLNMDYLTDDVTTNDSTGDLAMFGSVGDGAVIKNIVPHGIVATNGNDVAGLIGSANGGVTIINCTNRASVTGGLNIGGLIGNYLAQTGETLTIAKEEDATKIEQWNANEGALTSNNDVVVDGGRDGKIGGVVGYIRIVSTSDVALSNATIKIEGANNTGKICTVGDTPVEHKNVGGIVGYIYAFRNVNGAQVYITDCDNSGAVHTTANQAGGIVGTLLVQTESDLEKTYPDGIYPDTKNVEFNIEKCDNSGAVTANAFAGGIVGFIRNNQQVSGNVTRIINCTNSGAITAHDYQTKDDNEGTVNTNCGFDAGGIVSRIALNSFEATTGVERNNKVYISGCANTGNVTASQGASGIASRVQYSFVNKATVEIDNCVNGGKIDTDGKHIKTSGGTISVDDANAAGMLAFAQFYRGTNNTTITIKNSTNYGSVTKSNANNNGQIAGILGNYLSAGAVNADIIIDNCDNYANFGSSDNRLHDKNFGGIVGRGLVEGDYYNSKEYHSHDNDFTISNCENHGSLYSDHLGKNNNGTDNLNDTANVAGILGAWIYQKISSYNENPDGYDTARCYDNTLNITNCSNGGAVVGMGNVGGIVGQALNQYPTENCTITVGGCVNSGAITVDYERAGGIFGYFRHSGSPTNTNYKITNCENTGTITSTRSGTGSATDIYARIGGILGYSESGSSSNISLLVETCKNTGAVSCTNNLAKRAGGIVGDVNFGSGAKGFKLDIIDCTNGGVISGYYEAAGILSRFDSSSDNTGYESSYLNIEKCKNVGEISATNSRAGGIIGVIFVQNSVKQPFDLTLSELWNGGAVSSGYQVGGLAAQFIIAVNDADISFENCLNTGDVTATQSSAETGGLIGTGLYNTCYPFELTNCYNAGKITVPANATNTGHIIGVHPNQGNVVAEKVYYIPQTLAAKTLTACGTKATEDVAFEAYKGETVVTDNGTDSVWTYGRNNGLELKVFHVCNTNNQWYTLSGEKLISICESANCASKIGFGKEYSVTNVVYVKNGVTPSGSSFYGSETNPFGTLEEANNYIDLVTRNDVTVVVMGKVSVPADYLIKASVLTGEGHNGTLYFENQSLNEENKGLNFEHYHTFVANTEGSTVENLHILTKDHDGLFFYADGNRLEMGTGLTMESEDDDEFNIVDTGSGQTTGVGARVYVFGGRNVQKQLAENAHLFDQNYTTITTPEQLSKAAPQTEAQKLHANITVRSGEYRHVGGWSYDFYYVKPNGTSIYYIAPTTGTTTMTIGKTNEKDVLRITNISPFGCDYESVGEGRVADITIDGDVEVYKFNLGSHVGIRNTDGVKGEQRYPVTVNLRLDGNMYGMETYAKDDLAENPWGFYAGGHTSVAIIGNISVADEAEAILDSHAFLGHVEGLCKVEDCGYTRDGNFDYANRSIILLDKCSCPGTVTTVASEHNLAATCISYPTDRMVCTSCKRFVESKVVNTNIAPTNHAVFASLSFDNMYPVENGVRLGSLDKENSCCNASGTDTTPIIGGPNGIFYVDVSGSAKYGIKDDAEWGTETNPIGDFMTAYRLATAFAEGVDGNGRDATIKVINSITWELVNTNDGNTSKHNDSPAREFHYLEHQPGKVVITSANTAKKAAFVFGTTADGQRHKIRLSGDLEMNNLNIDFTNEFVMKNGVADKTQPTRIHILCRNNAITMGTGLTMLKHGIGGTFDYADGIVDHSAQEHICIHGGFDSAKEGLDLNTNVTVRSGDYYYIGGTNYMGTMDVVINGEAKVTVGATGNDKLSTGYLSAYGLVGENTGNFVSNLTIDGQVDVYTLEPTAQNGFTADYAGANTAPKTQRVTNIYLKDDADLTVDRVHENGHFLRGVYEVNVYVGDVNENTLTSLHKICGHDEGINSNITGSENKQHINAFAEICTDPNCKLTSDSYSAYDVRVSEDSAELKTFGGYSYLNVRSSHKNYANSFNQKSKIYVNVYKMDQNISALVSWKSGFDSGYYVDGETNYGIARFIFNGTPYKDTAELLEDSGIIYLFANDISKANFDNVIGKSGTAQTFYADVTKIPTSKTDALFAVAYMKINGKIFYSPIKTGTVNFDRLVAID